MKIKVVISSAASILLCLGYLTAIVGINIHIDHHDGEVYVVSLLGRTDCESLHPDDHCHCLAHHHGHCHADDEDCENEISVITLTGDGVVHVCDFSPSAQFASSIQTPVPAICHSGYAYSYDVAVSPPRQQLASFCVLRV